MKRYLRQWLAFAKHLLAAHKGRPVALLVLLGLSALNLSSEWPNDIARPAFLGALDAAVPDTFKSARQLLFDQYQRRFPRIPSSEPVTIVAIDEDTLARMGQWPWPRNRLAKLIDAIAAQHPLAIGLSIYMPEPDQTSPDKVAGNLPKTAAALAAGLRALPSHEALLARSLRAAPTILGAVGFENAAFTTSTGLRTVPISVHGPNPLQWVQRFNHVLASLPELQAAAQGEAMLSAPVEGGVIRRLPMVFGLGDKLVPSLPLEMLRLATGSSAIDVFADGAGVQGVGVADVTVPTQADGDIWLHFASIQATRNRYVSARDILAGKVDPERIRDKLVLVGLTGAGLADMRTTALGELVPGIEIQAQAMETVFEGRFLRRPVWLKWAESSFILVFGLLIIWYVPRTGSRRLAVFMRAVPKASAVLGIVLNLLLLSLSFLVFVRLGLLVDATSIFIVLSAVMSCFFSTNLLHADEKTRHAAEPAQGQGANAGRAPAMAQAGPF